MRIYVDFDNTIVESNKKVIEILNKNFCLNKTEKDLTDYNYNSIAPITIKDKLDIFDSDQFFENLDFKEGFLDVFYKYCDTMEFIIITKGTKQNLNKKRNWIVNNIKFPNKIGFIGVDINCQTKCKIDMKNSFQIDDCVSELRTNAKIKILYKNYNNFKWQNNYMNKDILVVNEWQQIDEILNFYFKYDYKTLKEKVLNVNNLLD